MEIVFKLFFYFFPIKCNEINTMSNVYVESKVLYCSLLFI